MFTHYSSTERLTPICHVWSQALPNTVGAGTTPLETEKSMWGKNPVSHLARSRRATFMKSTFSQLYKVEYADLYRRVNAWRLTVLNVGKERREDHLYVFVSVTHNQYSVVILSCVQIWTWDVWRHVITSVTALLDDRSLLSCNRASTTCTDLGGGDSSVCLSPICVVLHDKSWHYHRQIQIVVNLWRPVVQGLWLSWSSLLLGDFVLAVSLTQSQAFLLCEIDQVCCFMYSLFHYSQFRITDRAKARRGPAEGRREGVRVMKRRRATAWNKSLIGTTWWGIGRPRWRDNRRNFNSRNQFIQNPPSFPERCCKKESRYELLQRHYYQETAMIESS
jgi:hypothetical protein